MKRIPTFMALAIAALAAVVSSRAAEPGCNAEPTCAAAPVCDPGTCCPKCGCHEGLVPVCHSYCTTKKETKYHYCCKCEDICIPDHCPPCPKCGCGNGGCAEGCGNDCGCGGECHCLIIEQHHLVKKKYTVETPVRKCTVEWVCPHCGCSCGCSEGAAPAAAPAPAPAGPQPPMPPAPPAPGKSAQAPSGARSFAADFR